MAGEMHPILALVLLGNTSEEVSASTAAPKSAATQSTQASVSQSIAASDISETIITLKDSERSYAQAATQTFNAAGLNNIVFNFVAETGPASVNITTSAPSDGFMSLTDLLGQPPVSVTQPSALPNNVVPFPGPSSDPVLRKAA